MSIWGSGSYENDDAADWLSELSENLSLSFLIEAVSEVADAHIGYMEIPECTVAIAAAELLTELLGLPTKKSFLDEEEIGILVSQLQRESTKNQKILLMKSINAVELILNDEENSELRQIWEENAVSMPIWIAEMQSLVNKLQKFTSSYEL